MFVPKNFKKKELKESAYSIGHFTLSWRDKIFIIFMLAYDRRF